MARNLVTGGFGFIGSYLLRQFLEDGEAVVIFQRRKIPPPGEKIKDRVKVVKGELSNSNHFLEVVKENNIDTIYNVAALLVRDCKERPAEGLQTNVTGMLNVLEAARFCGLSDVIFVSSRMVYGAAPPSKVSDDTPHKPTLMYAITKLCCERLGEYYHRKYGVNFRGIRFPMVIGPGREISYYYGDYPVRLRCPRAARHTPSTWMRPILQL